MKTKRNHFSFKKLLSELDEAESTSRQKWEQLQHVLQKEWPDKQTAFAARDKARADYDKAYDISRALYLKFYALD